MDSHGRSVASSFPPTHQSLDSLVRQILEAMGATTGEGFFRTLAEQLCLVCQVDIAAIARIDPNRPDVAETIAFVRHGELLPNMTYDLQGTPCEQLASKKFCHFTSNVQDAFPENQYLRDLGIQSYMGVSLTASTGQQLGIIILEHTSIIPDPLQAELILKIAAPRAAAELAHVRTENALAMFRSLVDRANDTIEVLDPATGRVLDVNEKGLQMHGYTREEYLALHIPEIDPTVSDPAAWRKAMQTMRETGSLMHEGLHRRKDGSFFPVEVSCTWIDLDRDYAVAVVRDISERKRAEEAVRESELRLRTLLENLDNVAVQAYEPDGTITFWNQASEQLYGYSAAEAIGGNLLDLLHDETSRAAEAAIMAKAVTTGVMPPAEEAEVVRHDGKRVHVFASRILRPRPGMLPEFFCFDVDVTGRKKTEEELAVRQAELLHASRLSTVGEMVAAISHEVAQPLSAIGNFGATIAHIAESLSGEHRAALMEFSQSIVQQSRRCGSILQRLRDFSRRVSPPRAQCDVNQLLRESVELMSNELRGHDIRIFWDLAPDLPSVYCDSIQIGQVIVNLLTNARDELRAVPPAERSIVIRSRNDAEGIVFAVEDRGRGIPSEVAARLFEPFFTTKANGMGIGLSICKNIVHDHSGRIEALTGSPCGTRIQITLPKSEGS